MKRNKKIPKKRNLCAMAPIMHKGGAHVKSKKTARRIAKRQIRESIDPET